MLYGSASPPDGLAGAKAGSPHSNGTHKGQVMLAQSLASAEKSAYNSG